MPANAPPLRQSPIIGLKRSPPPEFGGKCAFDAMRTAPQTRFIMFAQSPPKSTAINSQTNTLASG